MINQELNSVQKFLKNEANVQEFLAFKVNGWNKLSPSDQQIKLTELEKNQDLLEDEMADWMIFRGMCFK